MRNTGMQGAHSEAAAAPRGVAAKGMHKYMFLNTYLMNYFTFHGKYV